MRVWRHSLDDLDEMMLNMELTGRRKTRRPQRRFMNVVKDMQRAGVTGEEVERTAECSQAYRSLITLTRTFFCINKYFL